MKKIVGISTSSSSKSINKELLTYTLRHIEGDTEMIGLNQKSPIYNIDIENGDGIPLDTKELYTQLQEFDGFVIALPEHNGSMTALFKNTLDWLSRVNKIIFNNKPVLLISTSPGPSGGQYVVSQVKTVIPFLGANQISTFSLKNFYDSFRDGAIVNSQDHEEFSKVIEVYNANV